MGILAGQLPSATLLVLRQAGLRAHESISGQCLPVFLQWRVLTVSHLPLRGQRRDCVIGNNAHRLPVSSIKLLFSGHLKRGKHYNMFVPGDKRK